MTKPTVSTAGEAMPKIDRRALMARAWVIFRQTYRYPQIKFADIGRPCFAWALKQAWIEARETARLAAIMPAEKAQRIRTLQNLISRTAFIDHYPTYHCRPHRPPRRTPPTPGLKGAVMARAKLIWESSTSHNSRDLVLEAQFRGPQILRTCLESLLSKTGRVKGLGRRDPLIKTVRTSFTPSNSSAFRLKAVSVVDASLNPAW
jgi:hypothetical protein